MQIGGFQRAKCNPGQQCATIPAQATWGQGLFAEAKEVLWMRCSASTFKSTYWKFTRTKLNMHACMRCLCVWLMLQGKEY
jgi:hypothetical protein